MSQMLVRVQQFCDASGPDSSATEDGLLDLGRLFSNGPDFGLSGRSSVWRSLETWKACGQSL